MSASNLGWNLSLGAPPMLRRATTWWTTEAHLLDGVAPGFLIDVIGRRHMLAGAVVPLSALLTNANTTTAATRIDASGALVACAAGELRIDRTNGVDELLCEGQLTNKVTCRKHNPVDTSNLTKSGDAAATLSVVDDTAALVAAGLAGLCSNGRVYRLDNSAGTSSALVSIAGATGSTSPHSFGAYVRSANGGDVGVFCAASSQSNLVATTATTFGLLKNEGIVPEGTDATLWVRASAGAVVHFVLPQLVAAALLGSIVPGDTLAAVTRTADLVQFATPAAAVLQGSGAAVAWRGIVPSYVTSETMFAVGQAKIFIARNGPNLQQVASWNGTGGCASPSGSPLSGNFGACFGAGPSGSAMGLSAAANVGTSLPTLASYGQAGAWIGPTLGLVAGQILRVRQIVGWALPDRPSVAGVQLQARAVA